MHTTPLALPTWLPAANHNGGLLLFPGTPLTLAVLLRRGRTRAWWTGLGLYVAAPVGLA